MTNDQLRKLFWKRGQRKLSMKMRNLDPNADVSLKITVWDERDCCHVALYVGDENGPCLIEWRDEAVREAIEDGFLKIGWLKDNDRLAWNSAVDYATHLGILPKNWNQEL